MKKKDQITFEKLSTAWQGAASQIHEEWHLQMIPKITLRNYFYWALRFFAWCDLEKLTPDAVTEKIARCFLLKYKDNHSFRTRAAAVTSINKVMVFLAKNFGSELISEPIRLPEAKAAYEPKIPRLEEILPFLERAKDLKNTSPRSAMIHAAISVFACTGVRATELCRLKIADLDRDKDGRIFNAKFKRKWNHVSILPIPIQCSDIIDSWLNLRRDLLSQPELVRKYRLSPLFLNSPYIFPANNGGAVPYRTLYGMFKKTDLLAGTNLHPHLIRHWFATDLLAHGASVADLLGLMGHRNIAHLQPYIHAANSRQAENISAHGNRLGSLLT